ncbi:MAG: DUF6449 domain-containing protein [Eubacteriales bacterium]|jgi:ABC-2 type transport system permease protein
MTSRNLFFKLLDEEMKRRLWAIALGWLTFFFALPVATLLTVERVYEYRLQDVATLIGPGSPTLLTVTICAALVCGWGSFFYLHSRQKVDFYHSVPVSRPRIFLVNYVAGLMIYLIPYLVCLAASLLVIAINGLEIGIILQVAGLGVLTHTIFFLLLYSIAILAMVLTGNLVVAVLGTGVFYFYGPVLLSLLSTYAGMFFSTYTEINQMLSTWCERTSPVLQYITTCGQWELGRNDVLTIPLVCALIIAVLITGLDCWLHRHRASEMAGKAMAFAPTKPVIEVLLVVATGLGFGMLFRVMGTSRLWMVFGLVCGWLISHAVVEIIYDFDFKAALHHRLRLAISGVLIAVIACTFQFDLLHYDTYLPKKSNLESMAVYIRELDRWVGEGNSAARTALELGQTTNIDPAYSIAQAAVAALKDQEIQKDLRGNVVTAPADTEVESSTIRYEEVLVCYQMKNGRKVYRSYWMDLNTIQQDLKELYLDPTYKYGVFELLREDPKQAAQVAVSTVKSQVAPQLTQAQVVELMETYQRELTQLSIDDLEAYFPIASIDFVSQEWMEEYEQSKQEDPYYRNNSLAGLILDSGPEYPIYPTFHETIALLQLYGVDPYEGIAVEEVEDILVNDYYMSNEGLYYDPATRIIRESNGSEDAPRALYNDPQQIASILESVVLADYSRMNYFRKSDHTVDVQIRTATGEYYFEFDVEKFPQFVKNDLKYEESRKAYQEFLQKNGQQVLTDDMPASQQVQ